MIIITQFIEIIIWWEVNIEVIRLNYVQRNMKMRKKNPYQACKKKSSFHSGKNSTKQCVYIWMHFVYFKIIANYFLVKIYLREKNFKT